uniref:Uncharacterized protein n=1 Tax=Arundo donax TaxID=35708 RepID=A0A0A8ZB37_ARUDO
MLPSPFTILIWSSPPPVVSSSCVPPRVMLP